MRWVEPRRLRHQACQCERADHGCKQHRRCRRGGHGVHPGRDNRAGGEQSRGELRHCRSAWLAHRTDRSTGQGEAGGTTQGVSGQHCQAEAGKAQRHRGDGRRWVSVRRQRVFGGGWEGGALGVLRRGGVGGRRAGDGCRRMVADGRRRMGAAQRSVGSGQRIVGGCGEGAGGSTSGEHQQGKESGGRVEHEAEPGAGRANRQRQRGRHVVQQQTSQREDTGKARQTGRGVADGRPWRPRPCGAKHAQARQGRDDCRQQCQNGTVHGTRG